MVELQTYEILGNCLYYAGILATVGAFLCFFVYSAKFANRLFSLGMFINVYILLISF